MIKTIKHLKNLVSHQFRSIGQKRSSHWRSLEKSILSASPTCAACGSNIRLQVHHKVPFHINPELELEKSNLIVLCMSPKECHYKLGHGENFKAWSETVEEDSALALHDPSKFEELCAKAKANRKFKL